MKFQNIVSVALASTFIVSAAEATPVLTIGKTTNSPIHTVALTNNGNRIVGTDMSLVVGSFNKGTCFPLYSIYTVPFNFPVGTSYVNINGDGLWENVPHPLDYNCGLLTFKTDKQTTVDAFQIFNNGVTYTGSNPATDNIRVN